MAGGALKQPITITPEKLHAQKNYLGINFQKFAMTFRVVDYTKKSITRKMFRELIAEELHRTLSHINCTPASVACFGELTGYKSESTCCTTWVPKMHMANLGIFLRLRGFPERKNAGITSILRCMCVKMELFVLLAFVPKVYSMFRVKIGHFPFNNVVLLECRKGHDGGRKGQMLSLGRTHKNSQNAYKTRERKTRPQSASSQKIGLKLDEISHLNTGKTPKGQMVPCFTQATILGFPTSKQCWK